MNENHPVGMALAADHDALFRATGDEHQMIVFRSPLVRDDDPAYAPVREHAQRHGLALATEVTRPDASWMFGQVRIEWHMTRAAMRDGLLAMAPNGLSAL